MNAVIDASGQSPPVSMNTCLVSEPQMPHRRVSSTSQSGPSGCGSARSCTPIGVARQHPLVRIRVVGQRIRDGLGVDTEHESLHGRGA